MSFGAISPVPEILPWHSSAGDTGHETGHATDQDSYSDGHRHPHRQATEQLPPASGHQLDKYV